MWKRIFSFKLHRGNKSHFLMLTLLCCRIQVRSCRITIVNLLTYLYVQYTTGDCDVRDVALNFKKITRDNLW
ncbi:hypothetical protein MIDIC_170042 [Alphaproteobacteria bacterium]